MKIAYLLFDPGIPVGGTKGASIHVTEFISAAVALGHQVHLVASNVVGEVPEGAILHRVELKGISKSEKSKLSASREFESAAFSILDEIRPNLIYERLSLFFGSGPELARSVGARRILEINAPIAKERADHFGLELVQEAHQAERQAISGSFVVVVSEALRDYASNFGAASVHVQPNGVDLERFVASDLKPKSPLRRSIPTVGFVGSLKPWHGVENLILASRVLEFRGVDHRLMVVGDGPLFGSLREMVADQGAQGRVEFTGAVPMAGVPGYLAEMDIGVAPYLRSENFYFSPLKVLEYMAAGLAIVATDTPSIREMVDGSALLVGDPDPMVLADAIEGLLANPERLAQLGAMARRRVERCFGWQRVVESILSAA